MENLPKIFNVRGRVFSGRGEGSKFIELPWVKSQIKEKLGFTPYKGTLNIMLDGNSLNVRKALKKAKPFIIAPETGYCRGKCFKVSIMNSVEGAIVIPEIEGYQENILEVVAPVNLREKFRLKDGDIVEVSVIVE